MVGRRLSPPYALSLPIEQELEGRTLRVRAVAFDETGKSQSSPERAVQVVAKSNPKAPSSSSNRRWTPSASSRTARCAPSASTWAHCRTSSTRAASARSNTSSTGARSARPASPSSNSARWRATRASSCSRSGRSPSRCPRSPCGKPAWRSPPACMRRTAPWSTPRPACCACWRTSGPPPASPSPRPAASPPWARPSASRSRPPTTPSKAAPTSSCWSTARKCSPTATRTATTTHQARPAQHQPSFQLPIKQDWLGRTLELRARVVDLHQQSNLSEPLTLPVKGDQTPTVSFSHPVEGAHLVSGQPVELRANATDDLGLRLLRQRQAGGHRPQGALRGDLPGAGRRGQETPDPPRRGHRQRRTADPQRAGQRHPGQGRGRPGHQPGLTLHHRQRRRRRPGPGGRGQHLRAQGHRLRQRRRRAPGPLAWPSRRASASTSPATPTTT